MVFCFWLSLVVAWKCLVMVLVVDMVEKLLTVARLVWGSTLVVVVLVVVV